MRHKHILFILLSLTLFISDSNAKGGFSSGGGRSSGFSSSRSYGSPSKSYSRPSSSSRTNTTTTHNYVTSGCYGCYGSPMGYGGFGMGYGYSNGLLTGIIIADLLHPQGTTMYNGGGYSGNALLYPDGMVVNSAGYEVGTYVNGIFTAVPNGPMVAKQIPAHDGGSEVLAIVFEILGVMVLIFTIGLL